MVKAKESWVSRAIGPVCCLLLLLTAAPSPAAELQTHKNSIGMEFVLIPAGSFMMGGEKDGDDDETPRHNVTISKPFYLGKYEVTQAQWETVMGSNPSKYKGANNPVEQVSWNDAQEFIKRLNQKEGHKRYRLPTEAEWEYAARGGTQTKYFFGANESTSGQYAWHGDNSGKETYPVGQKKSNQYGLYDIYGNVYEWVQDWYGEKYYANSPETDPNGPANGSRRVLRGGSRRDYAQSCRSGIRYNLSPDDRLDYGLLGFRLALSPE